jgi:hypothetical protein
MPDPAAEHTPETLPQRSWFRLQFSLGTLLWMMLVAGLVLAWWNDRRALEMRLQKIERMYQPQTQSLWSAADILGGPDDPTGGAGKSWCPQGSAAADWVEVGFDRAVAANSIELYEAYSPGCVTEVLVVDRAGNETSIWKGIDPSVPGPTVRAALFSVPVPKTIRSVQRVKIHVDSVGKSPWPCLDAVGLKTASGKTYWATSSECSSVYGGGKLTAANQTSMWQGFW